MELKQLSSLFKDHIERVQREIGKAFPDVEKKEETIDLEKFAINLVCEFQRTTKKLKEFEDE